MTIQHTELSRSRGFVRATDTSGTSQREYTIWGSYDPDDIEAYAIALAPEYDGRGLVRDKISVDSIGGGNWKCTVDYVHPDSNDQQRELDVGEYEFSFDTGGGNITRTVSYGTTKYAKSGETAPDFKGAIGVIKEANETRIEGVQVGVPSLKFQIRKRQPRTSISLEYVRTLKSMTFKKNDATFLGFEAGELLFIGATGREGTETDPEVTYHFIASDNADNITVGDITSVVKAGHDYLWVFFEDIEDASADMTVKQPKAVYVEEVYKEDDYTKLAI